MTIGIWGDSITYGGPTEGWVGLLRKELASKDVTVYNRGICGDTSEDILKRFETEATAIEPDIVVFAVGANDSKYPNGSAINKISVERYEGNMRMLIAQAKARAPRVVVVGLLDVNESQREKLLGTESGRSVFRNGELNKYNLCIKKVAEQERIEFIDMHGTINPEVDFEDGVHPNPQGYQKMFQVIKKYF